jgi:hypothetical protein
MEDLMKLAFAHCVPMNRRTHLTQNSLAASESKLFEPCLECSGDLFTSEIGVVQSFADLVFSIVFEPGCEHSASTDAANLRALETAIFRDLPAILSTVLSCIIFFVVL